MSAATSRRPVVVVVGAGIAGVACARVLVDAGVPTRVLERTDSVGGRMGGAHLHGRPVDLGAAYFTARDPEFTAVVERWRAAGLAREWTDDLAVLGRDGADRAPGPMRWAAPGGLAALVQDLATGLDVELNRTVYAVEDGPTVDGEVVDAVVLTMPDPQALPLLPPDSPAAALTRGRAWRPVLTVAAGWAAKSWPDLPAAFVNDHPLISFIADDGERRGDHAPVLVVHARGDADPQDVITAVRDLLDIPDQPVWTHTHRWPHAAPLAERDRSFHLGPDRIGLAGDGWGSSRIETAWRSGTALGREVVARLRGD
jgi:predicted NAD/FAD-dependent oxidoreductase